MRKASINYKSIRERISDLERNPSIKGESWEVNGTTYFIPEPVIRGFYRTLSVDKLRWFLGEDENEEHGDELMEWIQGEVEKWVSANARK